MIEYIRKGFSH